MHWDAYETFSVLSGVTLLGAVLWAMATDGRRALKGAGWYITGGVAFIVYGIYVANQTSGTFFFPVWIFVIPIGALAFIVLTLISAAMEKRDGRGAAPPPLPSDNPKKLDPGDW